MPDRCLRIRAAHPVGVRPEIFCEAEHFRRLFMSCYKRSQPVTCGLPPTLWTTPGLDGGMDPTRVGVPLGFSPTLPVRMGTRVCVMHFLPRPRHKRGKKKACDHFGVSTRGNQTYQKISRATMDNNTCSNGNAPLGDIASPANFKNIAEATSDI
ncbi:hypothetical protein EVAR_93387_1 [Eumeta japonica]|uniref:Uncharacterized protein n=1 Tax=Eumeta variegata TaxID=151549 RepID=A0A4C1UQE7_EUMVA|nr:hypothetical protein EVAR_93387_1 [Eumeta japonica]